MTVASRAKDAARATATAKRTVPNAKVTAPTRRIGTNHDSSAAWVATRSAPVSCAATTANSMPGSMAYRVLPISTSPSPTALAEPSPRSRRYPRTATNATATAPEATAAATWESPQRALSGSRPGSSGCHSSAAVNSTGPAATRSALALAPRVWSVVLDRLVSVVVTGSPSG